MNYLALALGFLSGALAMYSLVAWELSIHDWRKDAWLAAGGLVMAVLLVSLV